MIIAIFLLLISLGLQGLLYYFTGWYQNWYWFWTWIVMPFAFFWGMFALYIGWLFLVSGFLGKKEPTKPSRAAQFIVEQTAFICNLFFRFHVHTSGMGKLPGHHQRYMLINNHLSIFDEFALIYAFRNEHMLYISKEGNFKIPIAGNWLRKAGYLSIIQGDMQSGVKTIDRAANIIKSGKYSICVAPEGTRNKTFPNPIMLPFHPGTFNLAKQAECPIVVVAIQNTYAMLHRWPFKSTQVYIDVVGVVEPDDVKAKTANELAEMTRNLILKRFDEKMARFYHLDEKPVEETKKEEK